MEDIKETFSNEIALQRLEVIENLELDSPHGQLNVELYTEFLTLLLFSNDLVNAKFLWKRIPSEIKASSDELKAVWNVGKSAWSHDYAGVHSALNAFEWSEAISRVLLQYKDNIRQHCLKLIAGGYTSIKTQYLANILGLNESQALVLISDKGWVVNTETQVVKPVRDTCQETHNLNNEEHLERLTKYILFLET